MSSTALFGAFPYVALALCAAGTVIQCLILRTRMQIVRRELMECSTVFGGTRLWRWGLSLLLVGHLAMLFTKPILWWNRAPLRLCLLEGLLFGVGVTALCSGGALVWRHLGRIGGSAGREVADTLLLGVLLAALFSGVVSAVAYRWGTSWGATVLSPYLLTIARGKPVIGLAVQMPSPVRLHMLSFFAMLAAAPFSRLVMVPVLGFHYISKLASRYRTEISQRTQAWFQRLNLASRLWPEEDK